MLASTAVLTDSWYWRQRDAKSENVAVLSIYPSLPAPEKDTWLDGWKRAHHFPSEIHVELKEEGLIADPYVGFNEHGVQCE